MTIARLSTGRGIDPRHYQIASLGALLLYGLLALDFDITAARAAAILATTLATQYLCTRISGLPVFEPRSALISGLSLCLLARSNDLALQLAAAVIAIAGKFVLRWGNKHLFNPTNFALVAMILATGGGLDRPGRLWVSPGQWGEAAFLGFLIACLGGLTVQRAARADVTLGFLACWAAILFGRALWLGQPLATPLHQMQQGSLLLFAFFMISDPKTTPDSRAGRLVFAALVATGAAVIQFLLFRPHGLLWSLAAASLFVPLLDRVLPGTRHEWPVQVLPDPRKGRLHETPPVPVPAGRRAVAGGRA